MKTYYISEKTRIDSPFYLVFANVADEEIVANVLNGYGYNAVHTSTDRKYAETNFKNHTDVVYTDDSRNTFYVDVKTAGNRYISISKTLLNGKIGDNMQFAVIDEDQIFFAKASEVISRAHESKYNKNMMFISVVDFCMLSDFTLVIPGFLLDYRYKQMDLRDDLNNACEGLSPDEALETVTKALQENYHETFHDNFKFVKI